MHFFEGARCLRAECHVTPLRKTTSKNHTRASGVIKKIISRTKLMLSLALDGWLQSISANRSLHLPKKENTNRINGKRRPAGGPRKTRCGVSWPTFRTLKRFSQPIRFLKNITRSSESFHLNLTYYIRIRFLAGVLSFSTH